MGVKHPVLPDDKPLSVAFIVLTHLYGPKVQEIEIGAAKIPQNVEGRNFD